MDKALIELQRKVSLSDQQIGNLQVIKAIQEKFLDASGIHISPEEWTGFTAPYFVKHF